MSPTLTSKSETPAAEILEKGKQAMKYGEIKGILTGDVRLWAADQSIGPIEWNDEWQRYKPYARISGEWTMTARISGEWTMTARELDECKVEAIRPGYKCLVVVISR
jgi:hypothetical protein